MISTLVTIKITKITSHNQLVYIIKERLRQRHKKSMLSSWEIQVLWGIKQGESTSLGHGVTKRPSWMRWHLMMGLFKPLSRNKKKSAIIWAVDTAEWLLLARHYDKQVTYISSLRQSHEFDIITFLIYLQGWEELNNFPKNTYLGRLCRIWIESLCSWPLWRHSSRYLGRGNCHWQEN